MNSFKRIFTSWKNIFLALEASLLHAVVLAFAILSLSKSIDQNDAMTKLFLALSFGCHALAMGNQAFFCKTIRPNKVAFFKFLGLGVSFIGLAIAVGIVPFEPFPYSFIFGFFMLTIAGNRICRIFEEKVTVFRAIFNGTIAALAGFVAVMIFRNGDPTVFRAEFLLVAIILVLVSLIHIMIFAFSRIQLGALIKIMRKTYVFEILYGLLILIFSFSFIFMVFDEAFTSYGDALWYSFAIVTTIGFGDFAAKDIICRILSVILGAYGIIVVAVITSTIVNFYSEVKNQPDDNDASGDEEKKSEEQPKEQIEAPKEQTEEPKEEEKKTEDSPKE